MTWHERVGVIGPDRSILFISHSLYEDVVAVRACVRAFGDVVVTW